MATARETIIQACREWIKTVIGWDDHCGAVRVIKAQKGPDKGPRPALPYLVVNLDVFGRTIGTDETVNKTSGSTSHRKGDRSGVLNVQGFGLGSDDWLEMLALYIHKTETPLTVSSAGDIIDISEIAGSNIEARFSRDFDISYVVDDAVTGGFDPADTFITTVENEDETLSIPLTVDLS